MEPDKVKLASYSLSELQNTLTDSTYNLDPFKPINISNVSSGSTAINSGSYTYNGVYPNYSIQYPNLTDPTSFINPKIKDVRLFNSVFVAEGLKTILETLKGYTKKHKGTEGIGFNINPKACYIINNKEILFITINSFSTRKYSINCRILNIENNFLTDECELTLYDSNIKGQEHLFDNIGLESLSMICWESLTNAVEEIKNDKKTDRN